MKKRIKKVGCIFLSAVLLLIFSVHSSAQEAGLDSEPVPYAGTELDYWYSDSDTIMYRDKIFSVYYDDSNSTWSSLSANNMRSYVQTAKNQWSSIGFIVSTTSVYSNADIVMSSMNWAYGFDNFGYSKYLLGQTNIPSSNLSYRGVAYYYPTSTTFETKYIYSITGPVSIHLVESPLGILSMSVVENAKMVTVHEFTHALGYKGHYSGGALMRAVPSTVTPTLNEQRHLSQVY